jgi:hypothetical protein
MQGLLLGLANGTVCVAYCAPALVPFLLGEGRSIRTNFYVLSKFLLGRLSGYLLFSILAWLTHRLLLENPSRRELILGAVYIVLSGLLVTYGLSRPAKECAADRARSLLPHLFARNAAVLPLALGFLTGLNLCPPFLLAFTGAAAGMSLAHSMLFFAFFFIGTSVYFMPAPLVGSFRRFGGLRTVGRMAGVVVAVYYFYLGIVTFGGGVVTLWTRASQ